MQIKSKFEFFHLISTSNVKLKYKQTYWRKNWKHSFFLKVTFFWGTFSDQQFLDWFECIFTFFLTVSYYDKNIQSWMRLLMLFKSPISQWCICNYKIIILQKIKWMGAALQQKNLSGLSLNSRRVSYIVIGRYVIARYAV